MNNVVLIGRLTKDPEIRYVPETQNAVATFTLAVDRPFSKEKQADFLRIVVFGKQAENCERFLSKGRLVGVQGRIQTGSYKTQTGDTRYTTDIVADRVEFLGGKDDAGRAPAGGGFSHEGMEPKAPAAGGIPEGFQALEDDDDIPF